jgi:hypothetical protein
LDPVPFRESKKSLPIKVFVDLALDSEGRFRSGTGQEEPEFPRLYKVSEPIRHGRALP